MSCQQEIVCIGYFLVRPVEIDDNSFSEQWDCWQMCVQCMCLGVQLSGVFRWCLM